MKERNSSLAPVVALVVTFLVTIVGVGLVVADARVEALDDGVEFVIADA